jgi:hypothetical protein
MDYRMLFSGQDQRRQRGVDAAGGDHRRVEIFFLNSPQRRRERRGKFFWSDFLRGKIRTSNQPFGRLTRGGKPIASKILHEKIRTKLRHLKSELKYLIREDREFFFPSSQRKEKNRLSSAPSAAQR